MSHLSRPDALLIVLAGLLAWGNVACTQGNSVSSPPSNSNPSPTTASSPVAKPTAQPARAPAVQRPPNRSAQLDPYELALDKAISALNISQSAQAQDDWNLVIDQWQAAIALMQTVPKSSPYKALAQKKVIEYQRQLNHARKKMPTKFDSVSESAIALPPRATSRAAASQSTFGSPTSQSFPSNQQVFQVPIKRREGNTPVIEVTFNRSQTFDMIVDTGASGTVITQQMATSLGVVPAGTVVVQTASAKGLRVPVGLVSSIEVDGLEVENVSVVIAGPELDIGLLGHSFFGNYDISIRQDVVEFRVR